MAYQFDLPYLGGTVTQAIVQAWHKQPCDPVTKGDVLLEITADKATLLLTSPTSGTLLHCCANPGELVPVGGVLAVLGESGEGVPADVEIVKYPVAAEDACMYFRTALDTPCGKSGIEKLSPMRKVIASRMIASKTTAPHFYLTTAVDMSACIELRARLKREAKARVSYNDMIIKACALALNRFPQVATGYSEAGYIHRHRSNVGFAVAVDPDGLLVPVIRDADKLALVEVAGKAKQLADQARKNQLVPADFTGGVLTVSNLGSFDVDSFIAIVNPGESAILAIGKIYDTPVARKGVVTIKPIMKITLSSDHRVIDGILAAKFNVAVKSMLESPDELLSGSQIGG